MKKDLNVEFDSSNTTKETLINNLIKINNIVEFESDYKNNIENMNMEQYLSIIGKPLKACPTEPCKKPILGDNYPPFVDTRIKPELKRPKFGLIVPKLIVPICVLTVILCFVTTISEALLVGFSVIAVFLAIDFFAYLSELNESRRKLKNELNSFDKELKPILADYEKRKADYQRDVEKYKKYEAELKLIEESNDEILASPELKNEYKLYLKDQKDKYDYYQSPEVVNNMKVILHDEYWPYCKEIVKILETGRADTLKEAINILISDINARTLLQEQQRKNDLMLEDLAKQRELQEKANKDKKDYYVSQLELEKLKIAENIRHNTTLENVSEKNAKIVALCAGCPKVNYCNHIGKKTSACNGTRK